MDYALSDDQALFRQTTREFLTKTMPVSALRDRAAKDGGGFDTGWWRRGADLGWTALLAPENIGGMPAEGGGLVMLAVAAEEMGRLIAPGPLTPTSVVIEALVGTVDPGVHAEVLESLAGGEAVAAWATYDLGCVHWDTTRSAVSAQRTGDSVRLRGVKDRVEAADQCDMFLVTAESPDGVGQYLVPADADGLAIRPSRTIDISRHFATVTFDDVEVDPSARLVPASDDRALLERQLQVALVLQLAETAGIVARVFEFTLQWTFDRFSFGRPLASYQEIKHRIADLRVAVEAIQATVTEAAHAVSGHSPEAGRLVSVAKSYTGDRSVALIQDCVQLHGAIGITWEHDLHLYLRRATVNRAFFGTPEEHRQRIASIVRDEVTT